MSDEPEVTDGTAEELYAATVAADRALLELLSCARAYALPPDVALAALVGRLEILVDVKGTLDELTENVKTALRRVPMSVGGIADDA